MRQWIRCRICWTVKYYDYTPYGLSSPIRIATCDCGSIALYDDIHYATNPRWVNVTAKEAKASPRKKKLMQQLLDAPSMAPPGMLTELINSQKKRKGRKRDKAKKA